MKHGNALWLNVVQRALFAASLGVWSVIALDATGLISLARCDGSSCASTIAVRIAQNHF
jgi:hypothetical protein